VKLDSSASRADEFQSGTSAGGVTGNVTGLELAEISQQSHVSVIGHNRVLEFEITISGWLVSPSCQVLKIFCECIT